MDTGGDEGKTDDESRATATVERIEIHTCEDSADSPACDKNYIPAVSGSLTKLEQAPETILTFSLPGQPSFRVEEEHVCTAPSHPSMGLVAEGICVARRLPRAWHMGCRYTDAA